MRFIYRMGAFLHRYGPNKKTRYISCIDILIVIQLYNMKFYR